MNRFAIVAAAAASLLAAVTTAQNEILQTPIGTVERHDDTLVGLVNPLNFTAPVFEKIVFKQGSNASYLQLEFDELDLPNGSYIEIESLADQDKQRITEKDIVDGKARSAYFNGFAVRVRLWATPGSKPSAHICEMGAGYPQFFDPETICGFVDNRQLSSRSPMGRLLINKSGRTYVCTAWLFSRTSRGHATAGHCLSGASSMTVQYRVPRSTTAGRMVMPAAVNQYPASIFSRRFVNGGPGNDWGVFRTFANPFVRQNFFFNLEVPSTSRSVVLSGYGSASGIRNFAQKTTPSYTRPSSLSGTRLRYRIDSTGGDSGAPIWRWNGGYKAVAIHTHGGCTAFGGSNSGTSILNFGFLNAYIAYR